MTYTIRDLCNRFSVDQHTIYAWIRSGELKAVNVATSPAKKRPSWRITQEALDAFEALRAATPPAPKIRRRRKQSSDLIKFIK